MNLKVYEKYNTATENFLVNYTDMSGFDCAKQGNPL